MDLSKKIKGCFCSKFSSLYQPITPVNRKPPSLINVGANCYLNSALQGISACDRFVNDIQLMFNENNGSNELKKLIVFNQLMKILNGCSTTTMDISSDSIFHNWNKPGQQDSYELLAHVLNQVYNELRKHLVNQEKMSETDINKWLDVSLPMRLIISYDFICGCHKKTTTPLQSDLALHISIPKNYKSEMLDNLVNLYFSEDPVEDYNCDTADCKGLNTIRYAKLCNPLPNTICIHLQRSYWNGDRMMKINTRVTFKTTLVIKSNYRVTDNLQSTLTSANESNDEIYDLASVIVHSGSVDGGHYICYKLFNGRWYFTSDTSVHNASEDDVLRCQPYVLFFEIRKKIIDTVIL